MQRAVEQSVNEAAALFRAAYSAKGQPKPLQEAVEPQLEPQAFVEPGPCVDCPHIGRCSNGMACDQFAMFIFRGGGRERWGKAPRQPNRAIFLRLFGET